MNAKKLEHPPKKKHPKRPRPLPVVPLSHDERQSLAQSELNLAFTHFQEAKALALHRDTPHAWVHSSYYAMYHLATAIILMNGGVNKAKDAPKNHHEVIRHFGQLKPVQEDTSIELGKILTRARADRSVADYGIEAQISIEDASASMADMELFFKGCIERFKLAAPKK